MKGQKKPLYRKQNKLARGYHDNDPGGDFRHERNTKALKEFEGSYKSIGKTHGGYDYTPLYKFLLSKVGSKWDDVHSEAVSRLDKEEPIFHIVELTPNAESLAHGCVRLGEGTYYSLLTVDPEGILVKANPSASAPQHRCTCCTYTFNGKINNQKIKD